MDTQAFVEALKSSLAQDEEGMNNCNTSNLALSEREPPVEVEDCPHLLSMSILSELCDDDSLAFSNDDSFPSLDFLKGSLEKVKQDESKQAPSPVEDEEEEEDILDVYLRLQESRRHHQDPIVYASSEDDMDTVSTLSSDDFWRSDTSNTHKNVGRKNAWTIRVQDEYYEEGDTLYFQLIPSDRSSSMILEGEEILESIQTLVANDSDVDFVVHTEFDDATAVMTSSEALKFLSSMVGSNPPFFAARKQQETSTNPSEGDQNVDEHDDDFKAAMVDFSQFSSCRISL